MTGYEIYIFVLCLVVFTALTAFFVTLITYIVKLNLKLVRGGLLDREILLRRKKENGHAAVYRVLEIVFSALFLIVAITVFGISLNIKINEKQPVKTPVVKVVKSQSMAIRDEHNKYLYENDLNDQFQMFDLIRVAPLPAEKDLKLYDIVVYEVDKNLIIHRIVGIREPDATHSERYFVLQGDSNRITDKFPVLYSQMKGIYTGEKIPYIGSFVIFMNSPAGYLCVILVAVVCAIYPFIDKKLRKEMDLRIASLNCNPEDEDAFKTFLKTDSAATIISEASGLSEKDGRITTFVKPRNETLREKYLKLSDEQKRFFDEVSAHAASAEQSRRIENDRYVEYKAGNARLVRLLIKREIVVCEYLMPNDNFKRYLAGNKVKVKTAPIILKITDENSLQTAKDSIDIAKKIIADEKAYKKEQKNLRRRERRSAGERSENE